MWCPHCNKETASVPTRTGDGVCCAMCGENYFKEKPSDEAIREARDIIAKWSSSDLLDQISTLPQIPALSERYVAEIATSSNPAKLEPPLDRPIEATAEAVPAESPASPPPQIQQPLPDTFERLPTNQPDLTADDRITAEAVATNDNPAPITPPHKVSAAQISDQPPTSPLNKAVETGETSDPQPRKMLPRKPQPRQQRQRTQPLAAADQGMKPMSRKLRVDSPGGDQPELPNEQPTNVAGGKIQSNSSSGARRRIDSGEPVSNVLETGNRRTRTQGRPRQRYIDDAHDAVARGPHFEVVPNRRSNLTSITGQFLA